MYESTVCVCYSCHICHSSGSCTYLVIFRSRGDLSLHYSAFLFALFSPDCRYLNHKFRQNHNVHIRIGVEVNILDSHSGAQGSIPWFGELQTIYFTFFCLLPKFSFCCPVRPFCFCHMLAWYRIFLCRHRISDQHTTITHQFSSHCTLLSCVYMWLYLINDKMLSLCTGGMCGAWDIYWTCMLL